MCRKPTKMERAARVRPTASPGRYLRRPRTSSIKSRTRVHTDASRFFAPSSALTRPGGATAGLVNQIAVASNEIVNAEANRGAQTQPRGRRAGKHRRGTRHDSPQTCPVRISMKLRDACTPLAMGVPRAPSQMKLTGCRNFQGSFQDYVGES